MTYQETIEYLDNLPGVLALFWFMENVGDEHPDRQELFFYCRDRVRRYQNGPKWQKSVYKAELAWDAYCFKRLEHQDEPT